MTSQPWQRIEELFEATLRVAEDRRTAFLEQQCQGDLKLHGEVLRLLQNYATADTLVENPEIRKASLAPGAVIGKRYRIVSLIGRGGMGEVYEAEDQFLHESVAIKTLRSNFINNGTLARQFQREIQLARRVTHDNICRVFEVGEYQAGEASPSANLFFTMELLAGETLLSKIRREGRLSRETAFPIAVQLADGLAAAHRAGVMHTDFKSGNVMIVSSASGERAVITDFGLARRDPAILEAEVTRTAIPTQAVGTVGYMSPEQLSGGAITPASDIYSFGIVLFEMATGQLPFDDHHVIHSAMQRASGDTLSVRSLVPDIDVRWERAIVRCLQKNPEDRFSSAAELADWFRERPRWSPRLWTRRQWIGATAAAAASVGSAGGLWVWLRLPYRPQPAALDWYEKGLGAMHSMTYEAARKELEQSITADPRFALGYATLARAYEEMDYSDRAKDAILHAITIAQETRLSDADELRLRALQFTISRDYDRAMPLLDELEKESVGRERASAALEYGWLAQQREDTEAAQAAYQRALKFDPRYAAAKLRLGFLLGRRGRDDEALQAFAEAERFYRVSSDYEGVTETLWQQANLLNRRNRSAEAMPVIEEALRVAQTVGNRYQEIRLMLLQGVAMRNLGQSVRSRELAQQAIDAAVKENMDNLASSGLVDLGNSFLVGSGDVKAAEPAFRRALDLARHGRVRRSEARAKASLISLCELDHRPEEAKQFEDVLMFYRQAGYRRELVQVTAILSGVHAELAEYGEGLRTAREALSGAIQLKESHTEALVRERIGQNLQGLYSWPEAFEEYRSAANLLGPGISSGNARLECCALSWRLGQRGVASQFLDEVERALAKEPNNQVSANLQSRRAEMAYDEGQLPEALMFARQGLSIPRHGEDADRDLVLFEALALIRKGQSKEGAELAGNLVDKLERGKFIGSLAAAQLALAGAWSAAGDRNSALAFAGKALAFFEPRRILEPVWRAHALMAQAAIDSRDTQAHRLNAAMAFAQLKALWPAGMIDSYLQRTSIKQLSAGLNF
jgi:serine/threonine protein kinase/Tfp pilus assembly protein PilF